MAQVPLMRARRRHARAEHVARALDAGASSIAFVPRSAITLRIPLRNICARAPAARLAAIFRAVWILVVTVSAPAHSPPARLERDARGQAKCAAVVVERVGISIAPVTLVAFAIGDAHLPRRTVGAGVLGAGHACPFVRVPIAIRWANAIGAIRRSGGPGGAVAALILNLRVRAAHARVDRVALAQRPAVCIVRQFVDAVILSRAEPGAVLVVGVVRFAAPADVVYAVAISERRHS